MKKCPDCQKGILVPHCVPETVYRRGVQVQVIIEYSICNHCDEMTSTEPL
jgi:hypothetical protein